MGTMLWILANIAVIAAVYLCVKNRKSLGKISVVVSIVLALLLSGVLVWYFTPFQKELPVNCTIRLRLHSSEEVWIEDPDTVDAIVDALESLKFQREWSNELLRSYPTDTSLTLYVYDADTDSSQYVGEYLLIESEPKDSVFFSYPSSSNSPRYRICDPADVITEILDALK